MTTVKLTVKQQRFADYYIESGNAAEAARKAGYSPKCARAMGAENLSKPYISGYIQVRLSEQNKENATNADEVIAFYTSVMRGKYGASVYERIAAAKELMKRIERIEDKEGGLPQRAFELLESLQELERGRGD